MQLDDGNRIGDPIGSSDGASSGGYVDMDLFRECVPVFQDGLAAREEMNSPSYKDLPRADKVSIRRRVTAGEEAWMKVCSRCVWIVNRAVNKEMNRPRTFHVELDADDLRQAGYEGVWKMMRKADLSKMESPVNYLMQWVTTTVERSAANSESAYGMPVSRLKNIRKVAAIREKLSTQLGHRATDQEVYDYANGAGGKMKTVRGRKSSNKNDDDAIKRKIPMSVIEEQGLNEQGFPMRHAITDQQKIDMEPEAAVQSSEDKVIEPTNKSFWEGWMSSMDIDPSQFEDIAYVLDLYDVESASKPKDANRLALEVRMLIGSSTGGVPDFARKWSEKHGPGPWDVFINVEPGESVPIDSLDGNGRRIFRTLRFNSTAERRGRRKK